MRRLYLQIYLTFVAILIIFSGLASIAWVLMPKSAEEHQIFAGAEVVLGQLLPGPDRPLAELQAALERFAGQFPVDLAVHGPEGRLLAAVGTPLPVPGKERTASGWILSFNNS